MLTSVYCSYLTLGRNGVIIDIRYDVRKCFQGKFNFDTLKT